MTVLLAFTWPIPEAVVEQLGWVLVHSLWQFAMVAFLARLAMQTMRRASAVTRHGVLVLAMALLAAAPVATWLLQPDDDTPERSAEPGMPGIAYDANALAAPTTRQTALNVAAAATSLAPASSAPSTPSWTQQVTELLRPMLAWIVLGWGLGVVLCSTRPLLGWHALRRLAETLFFYHPAVWWMSRQVRVEREHCCDDLVVSLLDNRVDYGRALVAIEQWRARSVFLALGATDGSLLARVRRLAGIDPQRSAVRLRERWPWALLGLACLALALSTNRNLAAKDDGAKAPEPVLAKLPGGIVVELIAVGFHPSKDRDWWRPGGGRLKVRPHVEGRFSVMPDLPGLAQCREFLIHIRGLPREHSIQTDFGASCASYSSYADGLWIGEHGAGPFQSKTATIRVGLTTEPFGPLVAIAVNGRKDAAAKVSKELKPFHDRVVPLGVATAARGTELVLESAPLHELHKLAALEFRAVDVDRKVQRSSSMASPPTGIRIGFTLPRERIARFEYQLRPYRHWVTFQNVSLEPGQMTAVSIVTESVPTNKIVPGPAAPAAGSRPPKGLEFLAAYPKLHDLSLDMTEKQFLEIAKSQKIQLRKAATGGGTAYRISTGDGYTVIVMFRKNEGKCTGIQRIRGEVSTPPAPAAPPQDANSVRRIFKVIYPTG